MARLRGTLRRRTAAVGLLAAGVALSVSATPAAPPQKAGADRVEELAAAPLQPRTHSAPTRFNLMDSARTGVDFSISWAPRGKVSILGINSTGACGGVAIGDFDGDMRPDIFLTRPFGGNRLYQNLGDFRFKDVTREAGLEVELEYDAWGAGPVFVDIDNDGDLDLYVCSHRRANRLYVNDGHGRFQERAREFGLDFSGASVTMAFADYDCDGDLDAYLVTNWLVPEKEEGPGEYQSYWEFRDGRIRMSPERQEQVDVLRLPNGKLRVVQGAQLDHFYRNDGGKFVEATRETLGAYSSSENSHGLAARWFDYNDDGYPDLYVSNDYYGADQLFRNNGDGTMTDVAKEALPHTPWYSMGSDAGDVNNDGRMDLLAADMAFTTHLKFHTSRGRVPDENWFVDLSNPRQQVSNALFINTGANRFIEAAALAGLAKTDWTWAVKFGDLDSDGLVDVYVTNGAPRNWTDSDAPAQLSARGVADRKFADKWEKFWQQQPPMREANLAFRNDGDLRFEDVAAAWSLDFEGVSFGSALGDLDGDGDLDIVTVNFEDNTHIYRNESGENRVVAVTLRGKQSNRQGIGSVLTAETADGLRQTRDLASVRGFMSADDPTIHFGLGTSETIRRLTVRWPGGTVQEFHDLPAGKHYTITESQNSGPSNKPSSDKAPLFTRRQDIPSVVFHETAFDDFASQPLLPRRLSRLGPGIACGDVDGDGNDDFYVSAPKGSIGMLMLGDENGLKVDPRSDALFRDNQLSEEEGSLWFDADGDGDQDLYVVNGGVEIISGASGDNFEDVFLYGDAGEPGADRLQDRLYLNDGLGNLAVSPKESLPDMGFSGSVAVAADFDRDGDLDLFVGGRTVPGSYPQSPRSALLRNDGGRFTDVTEQLAPGLERPGMVTGAIWSDATGDGWVDLLLACEWGPIQLWRNDQGRLADATAEAGLADQTGWWNGIAAGDMDRDGDVDYVVTNQGLNTRYAANREFPAVLFSNDFDEDGKTDLLEAKFESGKLYPVRDRAALVSAMPILAEDWPTFKQFAQSTLAELFGESKLESAKKLEASTLESGLLVNDGRGQFTFRPLPHVAQVSPASGVALVDIDGDGNNDVYLAQNFYDWQSDAVRMDGGVSQLLLGDGRGGLQVVPAGESGLVLPENARAVCVSDINHDQRPDFLVTVNDGPLAAFENQSGGDNRRLEVRLRGRRENPTAVGARLDLELSDGSKQAAEIYSGQGYLSQSTAAWFVGLGRSSQPKRIDVHWPDGQQTSYSVDPSARQVVLEQPES